MTTLNPVALRWFLGSTTAAVLGLILDLIRPENEPLELASWLFYPGLLVVVLSYLFLFFTKEERSEAPEGLAYRNFVVGVSLVAGAVFTVYHAGLERYAPFWDSAGYWKYCLYYISNYWPSPYKGIDSVYHSIKREEYNQLAPMLMSPGLRVFGQAFPAYTLAIYTLFLAPAAWQCGYLLRSVGREIMPAHSRFMDWVSALMLLALPPVLIPMCNGMLDLVGLPFTFTLVLAIRQDAFRRWPLWKLAMLIPVVVILAFTRRWYGIWIGSYFGALAMTELVRLVLDRPFSFINFLRTGFTAVGVVAGAVLIWAIFFLPFLTKSLFNDYSDVYKAYQYGGLVYKLLTMTVHISWLWVGLATAGVLVGCYNPKTRYFTLFTALSMALAFIIHVQINNFSWHHFYLLVGQLAVLAFIAVTSLANLKYGKIPAFIVLALIACNWVYSLATQPPAFPKPLLSLFTESRVPPRQRTDMAALYSLNQHLKEICGPEGLKAYVIASSFIINDDILRNLELPEIQDAAQYLAGGHSHVDRRDPFPPGFVKADVIALSQPMQYHLLPGDQRIMGYLADAILDQQGIGRHYKSLGNVELSGGVKVYLLRKIQAWTPEEAQALANRFATVYPKYPAMAAVNMLEARTFDRHQPLGYGTAYWEDEGHTLVLHPGTELPGGLSYELDGNAKSVSFTPAFANQTCTSGADVDLEILINGQPMLRKNLHVGSEQVRQTVVVPAGGGSIRFQVYKANSGDHCDALFVKDIKFE